MSRETIEIVKATAPVVAQHGYDITRTMYGRMFSKFPEVRAMFNQGHQVEKDGHAAHQPTALALSIKAYAENIENLSVLGSTVEKIAQKHVSLYVLPHHYAVVGENLLWAIKEVLKDAATPAIMKAWGEAYGFLADVFIKRETEIREAMKNCPGGWEGWREFVVADKIRESSLITSFILRPKDGGQLPVHIPGQYIGYQVEVPGKDITTRNYTISSKPGLDHFRITVKLEEGVPSGFASTHLHKTVKLGDVLKIGVPCGDFTLNTDHHGKPVVFVSGGVGLTPVLSMLEHLMQSGFSKQVYYLDAIRNKDVEAMHDYFAHLSSKHLNLNVKFVYDEPPSEHFPKGPVSIHHLKKMLPTNDAHFYVCGPRPFMHNVLSGLKEWGVPSSQIHYEFFGPFQ